MRTFFGGLILLSVCFTQLSAQTPPNIVLILMDDMGVNDLGSYQFPPAGDPSPAPSPAPNTSNNVIDANAAVGLTPRMDSLATDGLRFTHFYSTSSVCSPSRAALMTGSYPRRARVEKVLSAGVDVTGLPPGEVTLPELLREQGYLTAMSGKWHLGDSIEFYPTRHGFEQFFGILYSSDMWPQNPHNSSWPDLLLIQNEQALTSYTTVTGGQFTGPIDTIAEQSYLLEAETEQIIAALDQAVSEARPFFLYFAPHAPHVPVHPHPDFLSTAGQTDDEARYLDVIEELDARVGQVLDRLDFHGVANNTIVIVTSDNGPWFTRPGAGSLYQGAGSAYPFRGSKNTNWEGGHRVPFLIRYPGIIPAGEVRDQTAALHDLLPTLVAFAGRTPPADRVIDGVDLGPLLTGASAAEPHTAFYYYANNATDADGVIDTDDPDKLKLGTNGNLYKVGTAFTEDFQELTDVSGSFPAGKTQLQNDLSTWNAAMSPRQAAAANSVQIELELDRIDVPEGGSAVVGIRLSGPATTTVSTARFSGDADLEVSSGGTLTFTTANWNTWQTVTLGALGDVDEVNGAATFRVTAPNLHLRELFVFENETGVSNAPPVIQREAPADSEVHFPDVSSRLLMQVDVSDDGLPAGTPLGVTWTQIQGPQPAVFTAKGTQRTFVQFPAAGSYRFRCEVTDSVYTRSVEVTVQAGPLSEGPDDTGLLFSYLMDEGSGTTTADASGGVGAAFLTEDAVSQEQGPTWTTGKNGGGLEFDGTDDLLVTPSVTVDSTSAWSAGAWVWLDAYPASETRVILQQADEVSGSGRTWLYVTSQGELASFLGGSLFSGGTLPLGEWVHVAVTVAQGNNAQMKLFVNGQKVQTDTRTIEPANGVFHIGDHKDLNFAQSLNWQGKMDEVKLYNRELSESELSGILFQDLPQIETFNTWMSQYESIPVAQRGPQDDFLGDGVPHLVDYAHGIPPTMDASDFLMNSELVEVEGESYLQINYRRLKGGAGETGVDYAVNGLLYQVEVSPVLGPEENWQGGAALLEAIGSPIDNGDGTETVTVRYKGTLAPSTDTSFLRLGLLQY